ncbi:MAG: tocopherol cyclase family protein [Myxococcota bacterium]
MIEGFEKRYDGDGPHYEVWYGKVDIAPERALWFRYTTLDGTVREAATWAVLFRGDEPVGGRDVHALDSLAPANVVAVPRGHEEGRFLGHPQVFHNAHGHLDEANAIGEAGGVRWDLRFDDRGRNFRYIPHGLERWGLVGSTYDDCLMDLRVSGTVEYDDEVYEFEGVPGMVGHIQGRRIAGQTWGWSHCNCFDDDEDAAFEGLSARAKVGSLVTPKLSAFVVFVDGHKYTFRTPASLLRADTEFSRHRWDFEAKSRGVTLTGRAWSPDEVALVEYTDTDGSNLWCYNSKLSDLEIRIRDPKRGLDRTLRSTGRAAFEYVTREKPSEEPLVS